MLIYHKSGIAPKMFGSNLKKNKAKSTKKKYKSISKRPSKLIRVKAFEKKQQKKRKKQSSKKQSTKKLTNKNRKFLEGLGLSVKPEN